VNATYRFRVHRLHSNVQAPVHFGHVGVDRSHRTCCLHATGDSIDAAGELHYIDLLGLLADGVLGVYARHIVLALLDRL
jgi:hypothetical protein